MARSTSTRQRHSRAQASEAVLLSRAGTFLVDLSGVTFMDSAGLRALIRVLEFH